VARSGAHSLSYEGSIYIFGGYTRKGGEYFNDIYEYKVVQNEWYSVFASNFRINLRAQNPPSARTDHSFVGFENYLYVYGGRDEMHIFSDIYQYSISKILELHSKARTNGDT